MATKKLENLENPKSPEELKIDTLESQVEELKTKLSQSDAKLAALEIANKAIWATLSDEAKTSLVEFKPTNAVASRVLSELEWLRRKVKPEDPKGAASTLNSKILKISALKAKLAAK
jgi:hypothetical protein